MDNDRLELLAEIASLYYEENLSQDEIATRTGYSRSMVSRLLTDARKQGMVEIRVRHPIGRRFDLERELQAGLGLKAVRVVMRGALEHPEMLRRLGRAAAQLVEELVYDDMSVGVSWGTGVFETVNALRSGTHSGVHVLQMIGSLGTPDPQIDGPELARRMAR
ncbi:MAG: MarR family transcriptional regulator, partial [Chloroflexi bacterium]|nr:MarR family transcriptional regulator [Chloroflexota bacterium]